ncbi:RNAse (barnase) inhibitor barstar [Kitasatospora sp. GP30]|uniref:barstar family protein n=1 Tax=Kitasatospora sp. GP30 TaxID=3035084 RepID=UPI000C6FEBE0|nr:barstar family protein [Kitasatospora sp. GP30]MDH6141843.1 RNAse (barnase) inhibitor barstar [Kitasatospora sp. GP30]
MTAKREVHNFLARVRQEPEHWVPDGSLRRLAGLLTGYQAGLTPYAAVGVPEFGPDGAFAHWLGRQDGYQSAEAADWVALIERDARPLDTFFTLAQRYCEEQPATGVDLVRHLSRNTFVTLYRRRPLLDETTAGLRAQGCRVVQVDTAGWTGQHDLHRELAAALDFPDYYGHNFDALNDCLRDVFDDTAAPLALVLTGFDHYARTDPEAAHILLDIVADRARVHAVSGCHLLCLVQSDDPHLTLEPVGAISALWNDAEWLNANRT